MSIQRYFHMYDGMPTTEAHPTQGDWVTYDDHVAEVERLSAAYHAGDEAWKRNVDEAYGNGVQDMRAACIAAVECMVFETGGASAATVDLALAALHQVLAALREVQP